MNFFEESIEEAFLILFEGASEGVVVVNSSKKIVATNAAARALFGYHKDELEGKQLNSLIPEKYHEEHNHNVLEFMRHSKKRTMGKGLSLYGLHKDGSEFPLEAGLNPFVLHGHKYVMALITDITVLRDQEQQIIDLNEHLEEKIEERTSSLIKVIKLLQQEVAIRLASENNANEALKREQDLNELKTRFLSLVSHEFKTPISGILTSATLIAKYTTTDQQEKREKHLDTIKAKVKYLNTIIDDFLSLERIDTGKTFYNITSFPLSKVLNEVIYDANMYLKDGQRVNYPHNADDVMVSFDEKTLELSLSNLIHNAIKYSGENSTINILVKQNDQLLTISIIDEGIGIPANEQPFVFDRYFRAQNVLSNPGTGIGLNIVQNHLKNLGGTVGFTSELGKGSTFTINIPMDKNK